MSKNKEEISLQDNGERLNNLLFDLKPLNKKPTELRFAAEKISSDGGLLLLREVENQVGM